MKSILLILFATLLLAGSGWTQVNPDSLRRVWKDTNNPDTTRGKAMLTLIETEYLRSQPDSAFYLAGLMREFTVAKGLKELEMQAATAMGTALYLKGDAESAIPYFEAALKIAVEGPYPKGEANACTNLALMYSQLGDQKKTLDFLDRSLKICESIQDTFGIARVMGEFGIEYYFQGNMKKSAHFYHESLKHYVLLGNRKEIARILVNLGAVYESQNDNVKALEYYTQGYKVFKEVNDKHGLVTIISNIGQIYVTMGQFDKALDYHHESLRLAQELDSKSSIASALKWMGECYLKMGMMDSALTTTTEAFKLKEENKDSMGMSVTLINLGLIAQQKGEVSSSIQIAHRALEIAQRIGLGVQTRDAAKLLYQNYKATRQFDDALAMHELYVETRDTIQNEENEKAVIRAEMGYEFEKEQLVKKQEAALEAMAVAEATAHRDRLQYSVILIILLFVFGGVIALGFFKVSHRVAEGLIFFAFLIFFEFMLVLADPWIDNLTGGAPGWNLLANALIALLIFPVHHYSEHFLKKRLVKQP